MVLLAKVRACCKEVDTVQNKRLKAILRPSRRRIDTPAARPVWIKHIPIKLPAPRRPHRRDIPIRTPNQRHEIKLAELAS